MHVRERERRGGERYVRDTRTDGRAPRRRGQTATATVRGTAESSQPRKYVCAAPGYPVDPGGTRVVIHGGTRDRRRRDDDGNDADDDDDDGDDDDGGGDGGGRLFTFESIIRARSWAAWRTRDSLKQEGPRTSLADERDAGPPSLARLPPPPSPPPLSAGYAIRDEVIRELATGAGARTVALVLSSAPRYLYPAAHRPASTLATALGSSGWRAVETATMHGDKGLQTMRCRPRNLQARHRRWPLRLGLFLIYVLVQYVSSTKAPPTLSETTVLSSSSEQWMSEPPVSSVGFTEEMVTEEASTVVAEEPRKTGHAERSKTETPPKGHERGRGKKPDVRGLSHETAKETTKMGTETPPPRHGRNSTTTVTPTTQMTTRYPYATVRPRRPNCSAPAIEQFPQPLMGPEARKHGGLIIHILAAIYTFLGLAIVCDDYFVSSLDRICEELRLSPDVAGATFMAAGSSAPELATVIIGVFFAKDDIGVSGVIGSAVFNIMFVISICGLCTATASKLNWWPLCRDCFFYAISILVMLGTIYNESISWMESLFMLIMYAVYCVVLSFNVKLERWAKSYNIPFLPKDDEPAEESALVSYRSLQEDRLSYTGPNSPITEQIKNQEGNGIQETTEQQQQQQQQQPPAPRQPEYYKAKEPNPNEVSPLVKPTDGSKWTLFTWGLVYPIHFMCRATMPDCRQEKWRSWYPFTFCISMIWISFYSYIMVWMITIIGSTLGIPDTVMGLTFVAAGVSVPDALSSLAVIKEGLGDMAVSNAVGSNVFDILVCLGLPWFIQTAMIQPGSHVNVTSRGLTYSTVSLLSTVIFLVLATHLNGWKLDRRYGMVLMVWYLIFIVFASLYELNVFGQMNPPVCPSNF